MRGLCSLIWCSRWSPCWSHRYGWCLCRTGCIESFKVSSFTQLHSNSWFPRALRSPQARDIPRNVHPGQISFHNKSLAKFTNSHTFLHSFLQYRITWSRERAIWRRGMPQIATWETTTSWRTYWSIVNSSISFNIRIWWLSLFENINCLGTETCKFLPFPFRGTFWVPVCYINWSMACKRFNFFFSKW